MYFTTDPQASKHMKTTLISVIHLEECGTPINLLCEQVVVCAGDNFLPAKTISKIIQNQTNSFKSTPIKVRKG